MHRECEREEIEECGQWQSGRRWGRWGWTDSGIESSRGRKVAVKWELLMGARFILSRQSCVHFSGYLGTCRLSQLSIRSTSTHLGAGQRGGRTDLLLEMPLGSALLSSLMWWIWGSLTEDILTVLLIRLVALNGLDTAQLCMNVLLLMSWLLPQFAKQISSRQKHKQLDDHTGCTSSSTTALHCAIQHCIKTIKLNLVATSHLEVKNKVSTLEMFVMISNCRENCGQLRSVRFGCLVCRGLQWAGQSVCQLLQI